jgi:hypothetical protein
MTRPGTERKQRLLLQCSIPFAADDWHVGRFSLLTRELGRVADVTARNLERGPSGNDETVLGLDRSRFDQVWLFGVDGGIGLNPSECAAVSRFAAAGGGLLTTRDHADMGLWLRSIEGVGRAHFFHDASCWEPDPARHVRDDRDTASIDFPNYHSGNNGDVQEVSTPDPLHPLMRSPDAPGGRITRFPAHPHEGCVGLPPNEPRARVVARGRSAATGRDFNLVVAFDRAEGARGRAIAESSFHHFADYNWDISRGAPSFVVEPASDATRRDAGLLDDVRQYARNCVEWLATES